MCQLGRMLWGRLKTSIEMYKIWSHQDVVWASLKVKGSSKDIYRETSTIWQVQMPENTHHARTAPENQISYTLRAWKVVKVDFQRRLTQQKSTTAINFQVYLKAATDIKIPLSSWANVSFSNRIFLLLTKVKIGIRFYVDATAVGTIGTQISSKA